MFPFTTTSGLILTQTEYLEIPPKELDCGFNIENQSSYYLIVKSGNSPSDKVSPNIFLVNHQSPFKLVERNTTMFCDTTSREPRLSTSNFPISTRNDRFKDRKSYSRMYRFKGLIDQKQYHSIKRILRRVNQWDFNIFSLERFSAGCPLTYLAIELFRQHELISLFQLDISKLYRFFITIEQSYHQSNPYHNALHAADVTQAINCMLLDDKLFKHLNATDMLCGLLSTICHDVDHPGLNNVYLNNSQHHLSLLYKQDSVLENHHWAFSLSVLKSTELFSHLSQEKWQKITSTCAQLIRATDISKQNLYISNFNDKLFYPDKAPIESPDETAKLLILQMAIKCADICNPCRAWDVSNCWAYLVTEEFFQQGDLEKLNGLPVSAIMNRDKCKLPVIQRDFIRFLVRPLFDAWHSYVRSALSQQFIETIKSNHLQWQRLAEQQDITIVEPGSAVSAYLLLDRLQLMQVMDYSQGHQLQSLLLLTDQLPLPLPLGITNCIPPSDDESICSNSAHATVGGAMSHRSSISSCLAGPMLSNPAPDISAAPMNCVLNASNRRCSLPTSLLVTNKKTSVVPSLGTVTTTSEQFPSHIRGKMFTRRTSLQTGQGYATSLLSTSLMSESPPSRASQIASPVPPLEDSMGFKTGGPVTNFPTSLRRGSAPAVKIPPYLGCGGLMQPAMSSSNHRRASLSSIYGNNNNSGGSGAASSSQMMLCRGSNTSHHHANSLSDVQITQVG